MYLDDIGWLRHTSDWQLDGNCGRSALGQKAIRKSAFETGEAISKTTLWIYNIPIRLGNGQNAGVSPFQLHWSWFLLCAQDVRFLVAAAYLSTPSTEILGVAEVSFETHKLILFRLRSCSFSNGRNLMIALDLYFVDFSERCTKRQLFSWGLEECHRKAPCPYDIAVSCRSFWRHCQRLLGRQKIGFGEVTKTHLNARTFWGLLTLKDIFIFISLYKYHGIRDVIEWCVNIWHWYVKKCKGCPSTISQIHIIKETSPLFFNATFPGRFPVPCCWSKVLWYLWLRDGKQRRIFFKSEQNRKRWRMKM